MSNLIKNNFVVWWKNFFKLIFPELESQQITPKLPSDVDDLIPFSSDVDPIHDQIQNIGFDNSMRFILAILTFSVCLGLWVGNVLSSIKPILFIFIFYTFLQVGVNRLLSHLKFLRTINFGLCSIDIIGISFAVYWTHGTSSPLYFLYFIPLIIQAFHRDWPLLMYYGFGGISAYIFAVSFSLDSWSSTLILDLGARILLMSVTVSISVLAVTLLRKKENLERKHSIRSQLLIHVSHMLNLVGSIRDIPLITQKILDQLNRELKTIDNSWCRIFLSQPGDPMMQVVQESTNQSDELKKTIVIQMCPAARDSKTFHIENVEKGEGCPTESFAKGSHLCTPILGTQFETYGVLFCGNPKPNTFLDDDREFFQFIAKSIGLTIQRLRRMEELRSVYEMGSFAMASFMKSVRSVEATYDSILEGFKSILNVEQASFLAWDEERLCLKPIKSIGLRNVLNSSKIFQKGEGIQGKALELGKPFWSYDVDLHMANSGELPFKSLLCIPLISIKGEPLGVVSLATLEQRKLFTIQEIDLASTFATRASIALENAKLHEQERIKIDLQIQQENKAA